MKLPEFLNFGWREKEQDPSTRLDTDANLVTNLDTEEKKAHTELVQGVAQHTEAAVPPASQEIEVTTGKGGLPQFEYKLPQGVEPVQGEGQQDTSPGIIDRFSAPVKGVVKLGAEEVQHATRDLSGDVKHDIGYHNFPGSKALRLVGGKVSQLVGKFRKK